MVEDYEVDPLRFANGRGDNNSTKKWELIASHLHKDGFVPWVGTNTGRRRYKRRYNCVKGVAVATPASNANAVTWPGR